MMVVLFVIYVWFRNNVSDRGGGSPWVCKETTRQRRNGSKGHYDLMNVVETLKVWLA